LKTTYGQRFGQLTEWPPASAAIPPFRVEGVDNDWRWLPQQFDASIVSDEATMPGLANFTGAFVGMAGPGRDIETRGF
jgi:beta-xylosidase